MVADITPGPLFIIYIILKGESDRVAVVVLCDCSFPIIVSKLCVAGKHTGNSRKSNVNSYYFSCLVENVLVKKSF